MLDTLNNPDAPEYNNILEWTGGKTETYDMDVVNEKLSVLYISDKSHKSMSSAEVYDCYLKSKPLFKIEFEDKACSCEFFDDEYEQDDIGDFLTGLDADIDYIEEILRRDKLSKDDANFIISKIEEVSSRLFTGLIINEALYKKLEELMGTEAANEYVIEIYKTINKTIDEEDS